MPFRYEKIQRFAGLANRRDARDIGNGLSKAQNISLDVGGKVRTIGGLADFTKVDGATALTQTAKLCPGSGLFTYGSDHWQGTDTIVDLLSQANAASDHDADNDGPDATTGWSSTSLTLTSVADTDGATIASNGTSYILKLVKTQTFAGTIQQDVTTVIGQKYIYSVDVYNKDGSFLWTDVEQSLVVYSSKHEGASWGTLSVEFVAASTLQRFVVNFEGASGAIAYADDAYLTKVSRRDLDTNWLALADVATAQVDLYNVNDNSFTAGLLDFGTVSSYVATIDTINFPTTKTITDSTSQFLNQGVQAGDIRIISGSALNNIMFVVEHVTAGTITARGNPFVVDADDDGTVTLTKYNPVAFHYVNEALRASPANGGIALRPKHYSFADRIHFEGAGTSERTYSDWYANDVGPVAPTSVSGHTTNGDVATQAELVAGTGFEVGITRTADDGGWTAGTYIIAIAFKYDDGQVSALYVPTTDEEFGTAILDGDSLTLTVRGKMSASVNYDERISGGYIFCRLDESDDSWSLLADISMAKGSRATLSGTYNAWADSSTDYEAYTANFKSLKLNVDSYESLAGIDPTTTVEVFTGDNAFWNTSVIARNRCFIGSVRYTAEGGVLSHFRDRILYSTAGAYDTFPIDNYIDVVQGDAEDYVKLGAYGNDLLCFKQRTLYIVDISDPDPAGWQMKQDANKGKYPFRGIAHLGAYFETPIGPAWCNEFGPFLYNGSEIVPLLGDKVELSEHPLAYQRYMELDGTDDRIEKTNDADLNFGTGNFSIEAMFRRDADPTETEVVIGKGSGAQRYTFEIITNNKLNFNVVGAALSACTSNAAVADGEWQHAVGTKNSTVCTLYIGGAAQTDTETPPADTIDDAAASFSIGRNQVGNGSFFNGNVAHARLWNRTLTAAEVLALYNGQPVLFADIGANQTELTSGTLTLGKRYRIKDWITDDDFTNIGGTNEDDNEFIATGTTPTKWTNSSIVVQIGCVAQYEPKGIGDAQWDDESGNSLDGTVNGATAIMPDDWASFYTDYSILGYHARTNQIIILRDCTGKWSSGQDYCDFWIVDLDTLASTTIRKGATAGIAFSNWTTDWAQNLIIAEQTSSTSVTIKKWTDSPASQAVGLIDIRTADIDFGNPAFRKDIDAIIVTYKSSAAQTNPVSYALEDNDAPTAWTRLTGNFDAETNWEKLVLEPTPFPCDSIRLKFDNPSAVGTIEINDITIRFTEIPEALS